MLNLVFIPVLYVILKTWLVAVAGRTKEQESLKEDVAAVEVRPTLTTTLTSMAPR